MQTCEWALDQSHLSGLLDIDLIQHLLETHLLQLVTSEPLVLVQRLSLPLHLVLVAPLQLAASVDQLNNLHMQHFLLVKLEQVIAALESQQPYKQSAASNNPL